MWSEFATPQTQLNSSPAPVLFLLKSNSQTKLEFRIYSVTEGATDFTAGQTYEFAFKTSDSSNVAYFETQVIQAEINAQHDDGVCFDYIKIENSTVVDGMDTWFDNSCSPNDQQCNSLFSRCGTQKWFV